MQVTDEAAMDRQCAALSDLFRRRIRDMKRIFAFYAASESGAGDELGHGEFWKFVKDCKFQKIRQRLPSGRVDLVFNQASSTAVGTAPARLSPVALVCRTAPGVPPARPLP